jgi:uncharacterized membrane protein
MNRETQSDMKASAKSVGKNVSQFAITIGRNVDEVYSFWRDFKNLSNFMKDLKSVQILSPKASHWTVELKSGIQAQWDANITQEVPNEMISWRSVEGSEVDTTGSVSFKRAPAGQGTVVSVMIDYEIPGGKLAEIATKFMGEDGDTLTQINLHRLKALLETGDIPTTEGQSSGRSSDQAPSHFRH